MKYKIVVDSSSDLTNDYINDPIIGFEVIPLKVNVANKEYVDDINVDVKDIKPTSKIVEDLGADSLDMIEMLMSLEEQFGISVPDDQVASLKTVKDIVAFIETESNK